MSKTPNDQEIRRLLTEEAAKVRLKNAESARVSKSIDDDEEYRRILIQRTEFARKWLEYAVLQFERDPTLLVNAATYLSVEVQNVIRERNSKWSADDIIPALEIIFTDDAKKLTVPQNTIAKLCLFSSEAQSLVCNDELAKTIKDTHKIPANEATDLLNNACFSISTVVNAFLFTKVKDDRHNTGEKLMKDVIGNLPPSDAVSIGKTQRVLKSAFEKDTAIFITWKRDSSRILFRRSNLTKEIDALVESYDALLKQYNNSDTAEDKMELAEKIIEISNAIEVKGQRYIERTQEKFFAGISGRQRDVKKLMENVSHTRFEILGKLMEVKEVKETSELDDLITKLSQFTTTASKSYGAVGAKLSADQQRRNTAVNELLARIYDIQSKQDQTSIVADVEAAFKQFQADFVGSKSFNATRFLGDVMACRRKFEASLIQPEKSFAFKISGA